MSIDSKLSDLWGRIDRAVELDLAPRQSALVDAILELELLRVGSTDNRILYAIGYAWYVHPERLLKPEIQANTEHALKKVLASDPAFAHAALYLGHHYYDIGKLELAQQYFQKVAVASLPPYLRIQLSEILVCCSIRINGLFKSVRELEKFTVCAEKSPQEDLLLRNLREALTIALKQQAPTGQVKRQLADLFKRLDAACGFKEHLAELLSS